MNYHQKKIFPNNLMNCLTSYLIIKKSFLELLKKIFLIYNIFLDYANVIVAIVDFVDVSMQLHQGRLNYRNFKTDY